MVYQLGFGNESYISLMTPLKAKFTGKRHQVTHNTHIHFSDAPVKRGIFHQMDKNMVFLHFQAYQPLYNM